jgi:sucrose-6-phosphate hydrolase SacC (GH32 family)
MSEVHFQIAWPDHSEDLCYSPSLVIKKYFEAHFASGKIKTTVSLGQLQEIETKAMQFAKLDQPKVKFIKFNGCIISAVC